MEFEKIIKLLKRIKSKEAQSLLLRQLEKKIPDESKQI